MDQRALAPPHGLSQRATSFIASQCQGIHQMPLLTLGPGRSCPARRRASATGTFDRPGTSLHSGPSAPFPRQRTARTARPGAPRSFVNPYSRCPTSRTGTPEGTAARTLSSTRNHLPSRDRRPTLAGGAWWRRTGSNRRPPACKAGALPAELRPRSSAVADGRMSGTGRGMPQASSSGGPGRTRTSDLTLIKRAL